MEIEILGSSSKGNCYLLKTEHETLMLECGLTFKKIAKALDFDYSKLVGCLVTHEHKDHCKAVDDLADYGIDIYMSYGTKMGIGTSSFRVNLIEPKKQFKVGQFTVLPFLVKHDAKEPLGFLIYHKEIGKLVFATDTYYIKPRFKGLNYIMVECNYSMDIVDRNIENNLIPAIMKKRLLASHFSLENVKNFLKANDMSAVKIIYLLHLSDGNSNAKRFKKEVEALTGKPTIIC